MFDFGLFQQYAPRLLAAVPLTLAITAASLVLGLALALPVALAKAGPVTGLRWAANAYILFFRGTPALVQIYLVYYGSGQFEWIRNSPLWVVLREPLWCAIIALGLNSAAYTGKMLAGAIAAVPRGTVEAAEALGLPRRRVLRLVVLPLAIRTALPAYGNEIILTLKASSLASTITLLELTGTARVIVSETYAPYEIFILAGAIYLALSFVLTRCIAWGERRLHAHLAVKQAASAALAIDAAR
jgi:His/Glu/Gln/Arg/opine family amino acid ABC transporter permease subunit